MARRRSGRDRAILDQTFGEVYHNPPKIVEHTRRKFGKKRAAAQKKAIALNKARRAGAHIPRKGRK